MRDLFPSIEMPLQNIKSVPEYAFEALVEQVKRFEAETRDDEIVTAMLASFGQSVTLQIHQIQLAGQFFCMEGVTPDGSTATLVQHYTQASLLLMKAPKPATEPKNPIGFITK